MKRAVLCLAIVCLLSFITGFTRCENSDDSGNAVTEELMMNLSTRDDEGFKNMFSNTTINLSDFDEQVNSFWEFFEGNVESYNISLGVGGTKSIRDGRVVSLNVIPLIKNIETDSGKTYELFFQCYIISDNDSIIGINKLVIKDDNDNVYTIGEYVD
ncbi:MAG: DUF5104 domain-containing protein [Oscillospiraceae bacterium]|nr:DUF5104 domain-containing protein [Oscillospiraceae bacterium]